MDATNRRQEDMMQPDNSTDGRGDEALISGFQMVVNDAEDLIKATANYSATGYAKARGKLKDGLTQARSKLVDAQADLTDRAQQVGEVTQRYVIANPWTSLAIVGSVGVVVGLLMKRRAHANGPKQEVSGWEGEHGNVASVETVAPGA